MKRYTALGRVGIYGMLCLGVFMILLPLYITVMTAFKTMPQNTASFLTPMSSLYLDNFRTVVRDSAYWYAFRNTLIVTAIVLAGNVAIMPMLAYAVSRSMGERRIYKILYFYLLAGIFIPFQVKMIPLVKLMSALGLGSPPGLALLCIGSSTCESVFLFVGYMHSLPRDIEEAACIDGASTATTFYRVVLPLMKPIIATVLIKNGLWIWNDYMLPLLVLNKSELDWTLTLYSYNFRTTNLIDYGTTFACYCLQMLPIVLFYVFMQKHIIGGLTAGAVKS